jgi:hypothetical protein
MYVPRAFAYALPLLLLALLVPPPGAALAQDPQLIELPGIKKPFPVKSGTVLPDGSVNLNSPHSGDRLKVGWDGEIRWQTSLPDLRSSIAAQVGAASRSDIEAGRQAEEKLLEMLDDGSIVRASYFSHRNERSLFIELHGPEGEEVSAVTLPATERGDLVAAAGRWDELVHLLTFSIEPGSRSITKSKLELVSLRAGDAQPTVRLLGEWECSGPRSQDPTLFGEVALSPDGGTYLIFRTTTENCGIGDLTTFLLRLDKAGGLVWGRQLPDSWSAYCHVIPSEDSEGLWLGTTNRRDGAQTLYRISGEGEITAEVDIPDDWEKKDVVFCRAPSNVTSEDGALIWSGMAKEQEVGFVAKITAEEGVVWTVEHRLLGAKLHIGRGRLMHDGSRLHVAFVDGPHGVEDTRSQTGPRLFRFRPPEE